VPAGTSVGRSTVIGVGAGPEAFAQPELAAGSLIPNRSWLEGVR